MGYKAAAAGVILLAVAMGWPAAGLQSAVPAVEILVPPEHVSTEHSRIAVVGRSNAPEIQVFVNGAFVLRTATRDSIFHVSLRLPYGLNDVVVTPVAEDPVVVDEGGASIEILCGPAFTRDQGRLFVEYRFHNRIAQTQCLPCHTRPQDTTPSLDSCNPCHNKVRQRLEEHTVDKSRPCTGCHTIESDLTATNPAGPGGANPCYDCHPDKIGLLARDYVHGPVAGGSCTVCHDPHGSQFTKTLVRPVPVLCESCHIDISGRYRKHLHYPFEQGWCIECHDPHATNNRWVLLKSGEELCMSCHFTDGSQRTHNHPHGVKPKKPLPPHLHLGSTGELECLTCHQPHGSDAPYLLRLRSDGENMCLGCHRDREGAK